MVDIFMHWLLSPYKIIIRYKKWIYDDKFHNFLFNDSEYFEARVWTYIFKN